MRTLDELPLRFWPVSRLPPGVEVWPKMLNLKAAEFAKVYTKKVSPRLRALGFACKSMRGRRRRGDILDLCWFAGGKYGGSGSLAFAAHRVGLPSSTQRPLAADAADFPDCVFYRHCALFDDPHYGSDFDFGKNIGEAEETADRILEVIEEQAGDFLDGVSVALAAMATLRVDEFDARMPALVTAHHIRVNSSHRGTPFIAQRLDLVVLLARLAHLDGRPDAATAWAHFGREILVGEDHPYILHERSILFEKILAGDPELAMTAADRAEFDRRRTASYEARQASQ